MHITKMYNHSYHAPLRANLLRHSLLYYSMILLFNLSLYEQ